MRPLLGAVFVCTILAAGLVVAAPETLPLLDDGTAPGAALVTADAREVVIDFAVPSLQVEDIKLDGRDWKRLSLPDGALSGETGRAALPVFGRLLQLPDGVGARLEVLDMETVDLEGWRIAPAEEREGEPTVADDAWYATPARELNPTAVVGEPAIMRDLRVVPVTFSPVAYDPAGGRVRVATRMRVRVVFDGVDKRNESPRMTGAVTPSFDAVYRDQVLNYDGAGKSLAVEPGSYLVICPNNATVISNLEPLLDWRRRQGYNVVLATTAETGTNTSSIKSYLQTQYNTMKPALEFVTLVGDHGGSVSIPAWFEGLSGYGGGGDHYYTNLDGGDVLSDIHIGRLSVDSTTQLTTVVNKIVDYETNPPTSGDTGWFQRATLVGDPGTSGITCVFVNQWAKEQLLAHNYTQIDTVWSGNFSSLMQTYFGNGGTLFTYRGWLGMSGFNSSNIMNLTNGGELGFALVVTCDTGSFASDGNCRSEAFLRAPNGGGVAGIGTATIGTHTRYNNCMFTAIIDHAWNSGDFRLGPALTSGKLAMYNNYNVGEPSRVEIWSVWNNLMGDPATELWTAFPSEITLAYESNLAMGANAVDVVATDRGTGLPLEGALVTLYKDGEIRITGTTDASGRVVLPIAGYTAGDLDLTVRTHNYLPQERIIVLGGASELVAYDSAAVQDGGAFGDSDGLLDPGENTPVEITLRNHGGATAPAVTATLASHDPFVTVTSAGPISYGDINAGQTSTPGTSFQVSVSPAAPGGHKTQLDLVVSSGGSDWTSLVEIEVFGPDFSYISSVFGGPGGDLDPGESGTLIVSLRNTGNEMATGISGQLTSASPWVTISDPNGVYPNINFDQTGDNAGDTFAVSVAGDCHPGHLATFELQTTTAEGADQVVEFTVPVGSASSTDPTGPDGYGYYAYDNTDTGYAEAPTYSWTEIDPTIGGSGTSVGLNDTGWEGDDTELLSLPFDFVMYGETFDSISVCSNGWLSMGYTQSRQYRNWALPTAGAADGMVCGFWDNLFRSGSTGGVFYWHDTANHRFIVEWSRMRAMWTAGSTGPQQTFQIILHDPAHNAGPTGDGIIEVMYQTVNNGDNINGYATAGLQNLDHTDGLNYEYWDTPAAGSASLVSGRAIRYVAFAATPSGTLSGTVTNVTAGAPAEGVLVSVLGSGKSFSSQADGSYQGSLADGVYDVVASHPSFAPDTVQSVSIIVDQTTVVDFSLTDIAGPDFSNMTVLPDTDDTVGPYVVDVNVIEYTGVAEQHFYYMSTNDGGPHELTLSVIDAGTGHHRAEIPGQPDGSRVIYWMTGLDTAGNASATSAAPPTDAHDFYVENTSFASADMEADDGWTVDDGGDDASAGIWTRVDPNGIWNGGTQITPEDDHTPSGTMCWITGQDSPGGSQGGNDVDSGHTTLLSPVYDLSGLNSATVGYWRWYTNDTGFSPGEDVWLTQVNDGSGWVDLENTTGSDRSWSYHEFDLGGLITLTSTVQFRFVASDEGSGSVVEAGVDDFTISGQAGAHDTTAPLVSVVYPNGGETITKPVAGRAGLDIEWTASDDVAVDHTVILYSSDGGATYPDTLAAGPLVSPYSSGWAVSTSLNARIKVVAFDAELNAAMDASDGDFILEQGTGVGEDLPSRAVLSAAMPNPFNPATEIAFALPHAGRASLKVFDVSGRLVRTLVNGRLEAGSHSVMWRGENDRGARAASGTYFYRLEAGGSVLTKKMTLLK